MKIGWVGQDGTFYPCAHNGHSEAAHSMPESAFPALKLCQNGYAFFELPINELSVEQLEALANWCRTEPAAESWEVLVDFLGIDLEERRFTL